jgi:hypothetical protein
MTGVFWITSMLMTPDASSFVYSYSRVLNELQVIAGVK